MHSFSTTGKAMETFAKPWLVSRMRFAAIRSLGARDTWSAIPALEVRASASFSTRDG